MENVILPLSSSKPFISYQLYGTKLFFSGRLRSIVFVCWHSYFPLIQSCQTAPTAFSQILGYKCMYFHVSLQLRAVQKKSRLPITGIFKENQYFDNSSLYAFFLTCHALKTWFELSKVKLIEMMWRETKAAILSSYRGFALPRVNLQ